MGKKNKDKKGKGKEKTEQKTEKKAAKRAKKELAEKGEEDIEQMIAEFVEKDKRLTQVIEEKCAPPSSRSVMTLLAHPDKEELIMFGGEYYTGKQMFMYNDLFFYNIRKNEWLKVTSPNAPPPRSSHQAVTVAQGGGQMWVFGGEFSSPSQNQFYHYRDLWLLHLREKKWEQIKSSGKSGPSARSGHRMVAFKNQLILFGGFHDNTREYKYYNDVWSFDLSTYMWAELNPLGHAPCPRSGCILLPTVTGSRLVLYGGYSMTSVKRDVDQGTVHTDMVALQPEGKGVDGKPAKWRWLAIKQSGTKPTPRSSMSALVVPGNHAVMFGGVYDEEEDEEQLEGTFLNDMYTLDLDKGHWFPVNLRGTRQTGDKKRRRKVKTEGGDDDMEVDEEDSDAAETAQDGANGDSMDVTEGGLESLALSGKSSEGAAAKVEAMGEGSAEPSASSSTEGAGSTGSAGDVFSVTIGPQSGDGPQGQGEGSGSGVGRTEGAFVPCGRMKPCLAVKGGLLYLYGGMVESGDRQVTLADLYALDLSKLDTWRTIIKQNVEIQKVRPSDSDSDSDEEKGGRKRKQCKGASKAEAAQEEDDDSDDDDDDDDDELMTFDDAPPLDKGEGAEDYFGRTQDYWLQKAREIMEEEGIRLSDRKLLKFAKEVCEEAVGTN